MPGSDTVFVAAARYASFDFLSPEEEKRKLGLWSSGDNTCLTVERENLTALKVPRQ